ncbi:MAG: lysine--tRNA ligase [bacterium]
MIDEEKDRLIKLKKIVSKGVLPYPSQVSHKRQPIEKIVLNFDKLSQAQETIILSGRLRSVRLHGGSSFAHLEDETGRIQLYFKKDTLGESLYDFLKDLVDIGDFIEVQGKLFTTHKGEKTLLVEKFTLLAKALLPLPEKWHGLSDIEIRYRKRYLDMIANPEVKKFFKIRSLVIKLLRSFFDERGFYEVETPILQPIPGGANARPFITHHNSLKTNFYLRIAPELYLKRLVIGGMEKVYEIGKCFRNEGIDWAHNPEFTQIEFYQAYADYNDFISLTEDLMVYLLEKLEKILSIEYQGKVINFKPPYPRLDFRQTLIKEIDLDIDKIKTKEELAKFAKKKGLKIEKSWGKGKIIDELYKEYVRPKIIQPTFIINHPIELSPLAKQIPGRPNYVERFQLLVGGGLELGNAFSELNDPLEQERRFLEQQKLRAAGDEEAQMIDSDFIEALKHGLPPAAGEGIGIDRLVALLTNNHNIKEIILFPTLRPKK